MLKAPATLPIYHPPLYSPGPPRARGRPTLPSYHPRYTHQVRRVLEAGPRYLVITPTILTRCAACSRPASRRPSSQAASPRQCALPSYHPLASLRQCALPNYHPLASPRHVYNNAHPNLYPDPHPNPIPTPTPSRYTNAHPTEEYAYLAERTGFVRPAIAASKP